MVSLLSEVGTLALLSAFSDHEETPDKQSYLRLCRDYGKSLGIILLTKWGVDENLIDSVRYCGIWDRMSEGPLSLLDIINLGLYHTAKITTPHASLPELNDLVAYNKLTPPHNLISQNGQLKLITENHEEIRAMIDSLQ